jgi:hypothetical protein
MAELKRLMEGILVIFLLALLPDCMCYTLGVYRKAERIIAERRADNG